MCRILGQIEVGLDVNPSRTRRNELGEVADSVEHWVLEELCAGLVDDNSSVKRKLEVWTSLRVQSQVPVQVDAGPVV